MPKTSPIKYSFNAGELSDLIDGRVDQAKYNNGAKQARNFFATVQGPAFRRGGTYMVAEVKDSSARTWFGKFQFNVTQAYILEFGHQYVRFFTSHAQVYNGAPIYEIVSPWALADLTAADGTFQLSFEQSNDVIYIAHGGGTYPLQKLQRFGNTNWTITPVVLQNGPFNDKNIDETLTVYASAETGTGVTLTASAALFNANMVGGLFYLEEKQAGTLAPWIVGEALTGAVRRRSDSKTYENTLTGTTGSSKPIHTEGIVLDGAGTTGVPWLYRDPGYGWVTITGYTSPTVVTATVVSRLPQGVVGSGNATFRWAKGTYSADQGYPERVTIFRERLSLAKGLKVNLSVPADFENFIEKRFGTVTADCAIKVQLSGSQQNKITWMKAGNDLILGTAGSEHAAGEITTNDPLSPTNIRIRDQTTYGGRSINPIILGESIVFVQTAGRKLRDIAYSFDVNKYRGKDLTVLSEHLTKGGIIDMDYQQEPNSIIWLVTARGKLVSFTYNKEQDALAFMPHPIGGNGFVEAVRCIPAPDNKRDEVWLIVRRTINGATKRYVEYMRPEYDSAEMRQQDCVYMDSALSLYNTVNAMLTVPSGALVKGATGITFTAGSAVFSSGDVGRQIHYDYTVSTLIDQEWVDVPYKAVAEITAYTDTTHVVATIRKPFPAATNIAANGWRKTVLGVGGYSHLIGQTVDIMVDGATHPQRVVDGSGAINPLQYQGSVIHVGLPAPCKMKAMRQEQASQTGSSQGKTKRSNRLTMRFKDTLGGRYGARESLMNDIQFRDPSMAMDEAPPLFSGDKLVTMPEGYDTDGYVIYENDQPLPVTLICWIPEVEVQPR